MIKATTNEKGKEKAIGFPKLMACRDGEVIFMISVDGIDATGFSLFDPTGVHASGFYSKYWNVQMLSDYTGEITLKNEII